MFILNLQFVREHFLKMQQSQEILARLRFKRHEKDYSCSKMRDNGMYLFGTDLVIQTYENSFYQMQ